MRNVVPIVLWSGALLGTLAVALFTLWALALYAFKQTTSSFVAWLLATVLVLAVASSWAVTRTIGLNQWDQLRKVHEPLTRLVATSVTTRAALDDLRAVVHPSPGLTALQSKYDGHEASIERLLEAEWQYQRGGPWDEHRLLFKITWDLNDILVHHARLERRAAALECPAASEVAALPDIGARLGERLQLQRTLASSIGEQFDGYDMNAPQSRPWSDARTITTIAATFGGLSVFSAATVFLVWRKRSWHVVDAVVAVVAIVLVNLAGWLALGPGADQERLRANLFAKTATVYRETLDLNDSLKAVMLIPRDGVLLPRDSAEQLVADYGEYVNAVNGFGQLVRIWDRAVLTGVLDVALIPSQRIQTHDDVLNALRSQMLTLYRRYVALDRRLVHLGCRSDWFPREGNRTREDELMALPF